MENSGYISLCLYYKAEPRNPYKLSDVRAAYWELEQVWYTQVLTNDVLNEEYMSNFVLDFPDLLDEVTKKSPTSLKAFMYDQYCHSGGSRQGFEAWLLAYKQSI